MMSKALLPFLALYASCSIREVSADWTRANYAAFNPIQTLLDIEAPSIYRDSFPKTTIRTNRGLIRGFIFTSPAGQESAVFQGVPFTEPPLGSLRFAKPVSKKPWNGTIDAFKYKPACVQIRNPLEMPGQVSEDCLYLNIYGPSDAATAGAKYPVVYYIFGGANDFGSPRIFDPTYLVDNFVSQGIVFVTTNYRVGGLGFFSTGTEAAPGNIQLQDVIEGLRWTNDEIRHFGGDTSRITIMGHSSGGVCTLYLTLSPLTEGLYQQALVMSGGGIKNYSTADNFPLYKRTAAALGCNKGGLWDAGRFDDVVACMRTKDAKEITQAYNDLKLPGEGSTHRIDGPGGVLPESIEQLVRKRRPHPYLLGTASNEAPMDLRSSPQPDTARIARACASAARARGSNAITEPCVHFYDVEMRAKDKTDFDFMSQRLKNIDNDQSYFAPVFRDAAEMRRAGGSVYLYSFDYAKKGTEEVAVFHAMDLYYIFGFPDFGAIFEEKNKDDERITKLYSRVFGNFVKFSDPTPPEGLGGVPNAGKWESLRKPIGFNYYKIDRNASTQEFYHFDGVEFWNEVVPYIENV